MWRLFVICLPSHGRTLWSPLATELTQWSRPFYQQMVLCSFFGMSIKDRCCVGPVCEWLGDKYVLMTSITRKDSTGNTNTSIKMSTLTRQEVQRCGQACLKSIAFMHVCHLYVISRHGLLWCFSERYILASGQMVYDLYYRYVCLSRANEFYHWSLRVCFPLFSLSPYVLFYWMLLWPMVKLCVYFLVKAPKQFSSNLLSSGYLVSSTIDASAPDDLRGVVLECFFGSF